MVFSTSCIKTPMIVCTCSLYLERTDTISKLICNRQILISYTGRLSLNLIRHLTSRKRKFCYKNIRIKRRHPIVRSRLTYRWQNNPVDFMRNNSARNRTFGTIQCTGKYSRIKWGHTNLKLLITSSTSIIVFILRQKICTHYNLVIFAKCNKVALICII